VRYHLFYLKLVVWADEVKCNLITIGLHLLIDYGTSLCDRQFVHLGKGLTGGRVPGLMG
jgi:hypothetical protein